MNTHVPMSPELLIIVGLPGSGKTIFLKSLLKEGRIADYCDDYEYGPIKDVAPALSPEDKRLLAGLERGEKWAIADTRYCDSNERIKVVKEFKKKFPELSIKFMYFENNPDLCVQNATIREGILPRHQINLIYYYTSMYHIPRNAKVMEVYSGR